MGVDGDEEFCFLDVVVDLLEGLGLYLSCGALLWRFRETFLERLE